MAIIRPSADPAAPFFQAARNAPVLSAEEEKELVGRWRDHRDEAARSRLIEAHLRLVIKTAGQFKGYGLALDDLVSEGNLGLVRALDGFDPDQSLRFSTYALWWIRAAMFEHVLRFSTPVTFGLSAERKKLFFKLRSIKARLSGPENRVLSQEETSKIAQDLGVRSVQVTAMERLLTQAPRSLDAPIGDSGVSFGALLRDETPNPEEILEERQELMYRRELLKDAWGKLTEREQDIVAERTLREKPLRLEDLSQRYGISRERVRQIEAGALGKLRNLIKAVEGSRAAALAGVRGAAPLTRA